jgi:mannose/fructose-specific phosphotransferase system component IIA
MEKNLIKEQLEKIEKLIEEADSKEDILFLSGMKGALSPFRYIFNFIEPQSIN